MNLDYFGLQRFNPIKPNLESLFQKKILKIKISAVASTYFPKQEVPIYPH